MYCSCTLEGMIIVAAGVQAQDCLPTQHLQVPPRGDWPTRYSNCIENDAVHDKFCTSSQDNQPGVCCVTDACGDCNSQASSGHCWCPYVHLGMLLSNKVPCSLLKKAPVTFWLMVFMTRICKWHKRLSSASPPSVMSLQSKRFPDLPHLWPATTAYMQQQCCLCKV